MRGDKCVPFLLLKDDKEKEEKKAKVYIWILSLFPDLAKGQIERQIFIRLGIWCLSFTLEMSKDYAHLRILQLFYNKSNKVSEYNMVDSEESTYIEGPDIAWVFFFNNIQYTIYNMYIVEDHQNLHIYSNKAKIIKLRTLNGRIMGRRPH